jgi:Membrane bound O-acyl transferase family
LLATDYHVLPTTHSTSSLWDWGHVGNTFLVASLTSLVLDGGATGLGILTSCVTGYTLDTFSESPLTRSTSPSDFWGHRWDRPVQSALKRGCYAPLRDTFSSGVAAFITFVVSGVLHEYVLLIYSCRGGQHSYRPQLGRQFLFFLWNGVVLILERYWRKWTHDSSYYHNAMRWVPGPLQTALVLMTVLPIGHWFTDEYIRASFYNDVSWGFPILVPIGTTP